MNTSQPQKTPREEHCIRKNKDNGLQGCGLSLLCSSPPFGTCSVPSVFLLSIEFNTAHVSLAQILPCTWMPGPCVREAPTLHSTPWAWVSCRHAFHPHRTLLPQSESRTLATVNVKQKTQNSSSPQPCICQKSRTWPTPCKRPVRVVSQDSPTALPTDPPRNPYKHLSKVEANL